LFYKLDSVKYITCVLQVAWCQTTCFWQCKASNLCGFEGKWFVELKYIKGEISHRKLNYHTLFIKSYKILAIMKSYI
jgi:hypothetical protein